MQVLVTIRIDGPEVAHPRGEGYDPRREKISEVTIEAPEELAYDVFITAATRLMQGEQ